MRPDLKTELSLGSFVRILGRPESYGRVVALAPHKQLAKVKIAGGGTHWFSRSGLDLLD